jgi:hypothetical protein
MKQARDCCRICGTKNMSCTILSQVHLYCILNFIYIYIYIAWMIHNSASVEIAAVVLLVILLQHLIQDEKPENK